MLIDNYTFEEFKAKAADFHGYPAPGLLIGGYMVSLAKRHIPEGVLFEALVETKKCLPDAVQLLTLCSIGNTWMKILNLGRYAVSLFDKFTGEGVRVHLDVDKMRAYPEIAAWFLKEKPKKDQDTEKLFQEIKQAGTDFCVVTPVRVSGRFLGHGHMSGIGICPHCGEAFPADDGIICRGCQGEAPYRTIGISDSKNSPVKHSDTVLPVEEAIGRKVLHDMTRIVPGEAKGPEFAAGQTLLAGDVCRLQQMGRFHVAVEDEENTPADYIHENDGVELFAGRMAGENVFFSLPPREGKINFQATEAGLLCVDKKRLEAFNNVPDVMCASRQDCMLVDKDSEFAGTRVIPLYIHRENLAEALSILTKPLFSVAPLRQAKVGILVTGTEVFKGLIEDKFIPLVTAKVQSYGCEVVAAVIAPDDREHMVSSLEKIKASGADLLITTGGLSVDPEDITRASLLEAGMEDVLYGMPVLPGAMSLVGRITNSGKKTHDTASCVDAGRNGSRQVCEIWQPAAGEMQLLGVPACALYFKTTMFDVLLPRLLAGRVLSRQEIAAMGEGGFCMGCKVCTWPKCFFVK